VRDNAREPAQGNGTIVEIARVADRAGFLSRPLTWSHAIAAGALPLPHPDPFDRLLVGQAMTEGHTRLSADEAFDSLGAARLWS
jgi:PIN domain nuclease of toxin-antitoxin system